MPLKYLTQKIAGAVLLTAGLLGAKLANGQANEFVFSASDTTYAAISPDSTIGTGTSDDASYLVRLKFSMPFGDFRYTTVRVSTNGFVLFGTGTAYNGSGSAYQSTRNPSGRVFNAPNANNNLTFVAFNQDIKANGTPVGLKWGGTAPNRWMIVQYTNFRRYPSIFASDVINFQIALYESGRLEARYGSMSATDPTSTGSMVGIRGQSRTDIFPLRGTWANPVGGYDNKDTIAFSPTQKPVVGRRFRFEPTPTSAINLRVLSIEPMSGYLSGCPRTSQETLRLTVRNSGTQPQSSFEVGYILNNNAPVRRQATLPAPLAPGATTTVDLTGAQGANLSQFGVYTIKGFASLAGDVNRRNDTTRILLNLKAPSAFPTGSPVTTIRVANATGWRRASGLPMRPSDSTNVWRTAFPFSSETIGAYFDAGNPTVRDWLYRPGLLAGGAVGIKFKMAVTKNFYGTTPVGSVDDDTLKLMVSRNCGLTWEAIAAFDNPGLQAGIFNNTLREFTYTLNDAPGTLAVGFYVTGNGTSAAAAYRWHLDDIEFLFEKDLTVTAVKAASQGRFTGCPGSAQEPMLVTVQNQGSGNILSAQVGYFVQGQALHTRLVSFGSGLGYGEDTTIVFNGTDGADLSQAIPYFAKGFATLAGDANPANDTLDLQVDLTRTDEIPIGAVVQSIAEARLRGWKQASGRNKPGIDSTNFWKNNFTFGNDIAGIQLANTNPAFEWYFRGSYHASGKVGIRFKMAVTSGTTGTGAMSNIGNDTLYLKASEDCGRTWRTITFFDQAKLAAGQFNNTLKEFTQTLTQTAGTIAVAFYFSNGGNGHTAAYAWHLDDLQFVVDKDLSPIDVSVSGIGRFYGCPLGAQQAVIVTVRNLGLSDATSATVSYSLNGGGEKSKAVIFNPAIHDGEIAQVIFSGTDGADLSQPGPYEFTVITELAGEEYTSNDTLIKTIQLQPTTNLPGPPVIGTYADAKVNGWKQVGGWPVSRDTSIMWRALLPVYGPVIGALVQTTDTSRAEWFYHTGFITQGPVGMRFKLGVASGTAGVTPIASIGDDTLKVVASYDCGRTWVILDRFNTSSITSGRVDNTLKDFAVSLTATATPVTVAFIVNTKGTLAPTAYRWLLDDLTFVAANDLATLAISVRALRYAGCARSNAETIDVVVQNAGSNPITTADVSYSIDGEPAITKTVNFAPALISGEIRTVSFSGPEGADLSASAAFSFQAYSTLGGDGNQANDTAAVTLVPGTEVSVPGVSTVTDFNTALDNDWKVGNGHTILFDNSSVWKQTNVAVGTAIAAEMPTTNDLTQDWFYHSGLQTTGPVTMRYKLAVARGTAGQDAVTNGIADDSLRIMASYDCGRTWTMLTSYAQADLTSGRISNNFTIQTTGIATSAQMVTVAFFVTSNRTRSASVYRWLIDDIEFGSGTDLQAVDLAAPGTFAGYCTNVALPVSITVRNNGFTSIDSIPMSYQYAGGPIVHHTFPISLASLSSATLTLPQALWITPNQPAGQLLVYVTLPNQTPGAQANDTIKRVLQVPPARPLPSLVFFALNTFVSNGFYQTRVKNGVETATPSWFSGRVGSNNTAATLMSTNDSASIRKWLISPLYNVTTNNAQIKFRAAVVPQTGTLAIGNDSLKVMYRNNCGEWLTLRAFSQASYSAGEIGLTLQNYTITIPISAGGQTQLAFMATNGGTFPVSAYTWHITSLDMQGPVEVTQLQAPKTLSVYPNPASTLLHIRCSSNGEAMGKIINMDGKQVMTFRLENGAADIDINALAQGMYTILTSDGDLTLVKRFIRK